jgi:hypothetical protein
MLSLFSTCWLDKGVSRVSYAHFLAVTLFSR